MHDRQPGHPRELVCCLARARLLVRARKEDKRRNNPEPVRQRPTALGSHSTWQIGRDGHGPAHTCFLCTDASQAGYVRKCPGKSHKRRLERVLVRMCRRCPRVGDEWLARDGASVRLVTVQHMRNSTSNNIREEARGLGKDNRSLCGFCASKTHRAVFLS